MLSLIHSCKGDVEQVRSMNFTQKHKDVELIIIDSLWTEETKEKIIDLKPYFKRLVYAPPKPRTEEKRFDFLSAHNTGLAFAEGAWCMGTGGRNEMRQNFMVKLNETIRNFGVGASLRYLEEAKWLEHGKRFKEEYIAAMRKHDEKYGYSIGIRPVELEANMLDTKWNYSSRFPQRYIIMPSVPIGNKDERAFKPIQTCGFIILPRYTWYDLNGFNEEYDVGCYWWDDDMLYRLFVNNIRVILDQELMIYRHPHISAAQPENKECREIFNKNLEKFPRRAPNDFDMWELHEKCMEIKKDFIL